MLGACELSDFTQISLVLSGSVACNVPFHLNRTIIYTARISSMSNLKCDVLRHIRLGLLMPQGPMLAQEQRCEKFSYLTLFTVIRISFHIINLYTVTYPGCAEYNEM